jgi:large subunit ribosomal protein L6
VGVLKLLPNRFALGQFRMSRIGKKSIDIPAGVDVKIDGLVVVVKGPKGELKRIFKPGVKFIVDNKKVAVQTEIADNKVNWGLSRALLNNMVVGVSKGFEKILEFTGVGFKAQVKGQEIELSLGFTNPVKVIAPAGVSFSVEKNVIKVTGIDKEAVGHVAAEIRAAKPTEPYKGTGIKYKDEVVIRKAGKKAVTGA